MEIKEQLIDGAIRMQGCADGLAQLDGAWTKEELVQCFIDRIDFCLARNFPDKTYLKKHFGQELAARHIYIDEVVELHNTGCVLLGDCRSVLTADAYAVCRMYVKHNGKLEIKAAEHAFVMVDALDDAEIRVDCRDKATVVVNLYARAGACTEGDGAVKIIHKKKETYDL